jgi:hypothetical protein
LFYMNFFIYNNLHTHMYTLEFAWAPIPQLCSFFFTSYAIQLYGLKNIYFFEITNLFVKTEAHDNQSSESQRSKAPSLGCARENRSPGVQYNNRWTDVPGRKIGVIPSPSINKRHQSRRWVAHRGCVVLVGRHDVGARHGRRGPRARGRITIRASRAAVCAALAGRSRGGNQPTNPQLSLSLSLSLSPSPPACAHRHVDHPPAGARREGERWPAAD